MSVYAVTIILILLLFSASLLSEFD